VLRNSIVANSTTGPNCAGALTDGGFNLDSGSTCRFTALSHALNGVDPLLGSLAFNGGNTATRALLPGSPAIEAGGTIANGCPNTDQRGVARPQGTRCDIGAFEVVGPVLDQTAPNTTAVLSPLLDAAGWSATDISVTFTANDEPGGSGVNQIVYSAAGAQPIAGTPGFGQDRCRRPDERGSDDPDVLRDRQRRQW